MTPQFAIPDDEFSTLGMEEWLKDNVGIRDKDWSVIIYPERPHYFCIAIKDEQKLKIFWQEFQLFLLHVRIHA